MLPPVLTTSGLQHYYTGSRALVIGINQYRFVNPLARACADAESVAEVLVTSLGFAKSEVVTLFDDQATKAEILKQFTGFDSLAPDDRLLVFFAGHGETVPGHRGDIGFLVPVDGQLQDKSTLIAWQELTRGAELIPAKHILFIMDACYSGLAIQRGARAGSQRFLSDMLERVSRQVITAGKADQPVSDGGSATGKNSVFTGHLLEGLQGKAANDKGVLTASHLMHYVYDKVANDPNSRQTPHYGHIDGDGDFILKTPDGGHVLGGKGEDYLVETLADRPEPPPPSALVEIKPRFAEKNGYDDPESDKFGQNDWSRKLGDTTWETGKSELVRATHWLAIVVEPVSNQPIKLDLAALAKTLGNLPSNSGQPYDQFLIPHQSLTTRNSVIFYRSERANGDRREECWKRFLRVEESGAMEYCEFPGAARFYYAGTTPDNRGPAFRVFRYVQIIGLVWNFLFATKRILKAANYELGVRCLVNLVGAKDTLLVEFSNRNGANGQRWYDPFHMNAMLGNSLENWRCRDSNFQAEFQFALSSLNLPESTKLITKLAEQLGLAYNHQSAPRCFNSGTEIFPWEKFSPHPD
jgi:hypothetical protein